MKKSSETKKGANWMIIYDGSTAKTTSLEAKAEKNFWDKILRPFLFLVQMYFNWNVERA